MGTSIHSVAPTGMMMLIISFEYLNEPRRIRKSFAVPLCGPRGCKKCIKQSIVYHHPFSMGTVTFLSFCVIIIIWAGLFVYYSCRVICPLCCEDSNGDDGDGEERLASLLFSSSNWMMMGW